ncbi:Leukocyte surface antigen CD53-like Protein [Tribolium castaneum]|uniref:Tetraspanin n=1 Tax=Tribolium castaneum TaxID=7070 RepID=D6X2R0_TRICA|nr:PREDICTED: 23 kDa integral membrane protein isoform X1 [Tribolium castaneum]EFA10284.1 Leukocyte surface antigen CD53-like Protein [Tribolium castaneum]|eukprot:XP_015839067.1 PREDICTED: 23 kDa integral membrane protein isoform X1 [Tribolium castaneum]
MDLRDSRNKRSNYVICGSALILAVLGLVMFSVGLNWLISIANCGILAESITKNASLTLVTGAIIIVSSYAGWTAIKRKNLALLILYGAVLMSLTVLELSIAIYDFLDTSKLGEQVPKFATKIDETIHLAFNKNDSDATNCLNNLQSKVRCCGAHGPSDYALHKIAKIPESCYDKNSKPYMKGCATELAHLLRYDLKCSASFGVIAAIFGGVGTVFVFLVSRRKLQELQVRVFDE